MRLLQRLPVRHRLGGWPELVHFSRPVAAMLVGILSDTHGHAEPARLAVKLLILRGAQFLIHCGDIGSEHVLDQLVGVPCAVVFGNTDSDREDLHRYANLLQIQWLGPGGELELDGKKFAVMHGDDLRAVRRILDQQQHDYLLQGHTHVPQDQRVGRVHWINPGALHRAAKKTVVILDTSQDLVSFLELERI